ncbi:sensor histidine kinase [Sporomusa malonica]|nr:ATP-binding protein [Sporomusa malonica]
MLFFVLISLSLMGIGLEKFYTWQKQEALLANSQTINDLYHGSPEEISLELERAANTLGAGVIIFAPTGPIKYTSFDRFINHRPPDSLLLPNADANYTPKNQFRIPPKSTQLVKSSQAINSQTILEIQLDQMLQIEFMVLERQLKNGDILIIRQPLAPMSESAVAAAHFMTLTGILTLLAGCGWAFFFSRKFTLPILDLNRIAQRMSKLDFSQKCTVTRGDELGELGQNINYLSDQLDAAISELNKKNQQLMADVEKERSLDQMRKYFVSSVSHELKTPISLILGYAEGLKEDIARDAASKDFYCSVIIDEAEKMDKLVKDLLNLSQIESGLYQLNRTDFDLDLMLKDIAKKYLTVLEKRAITLEYASTASHWVNGDPLRIEQILLNLFTNAIDHAELPYLIKITALNIEDKIRVFVYNSGQPIPEESLEKIWLSFYKVDDARTREYGRYGLGLSIVRAIQELHGNGYGVENGEGGVMFWFDLTEANKI